MKTFVGVDIGGTNVRYGLVSASGEILAQDRFAVKNHTPEALIGDLTERLRTFLEARSNLVPPIGIAIGAPGKIDSENGLVVSSPNLSGWENVPLVRYMEEAFSLEVRLDNDANLYALGEALAGAGRGLENLIVVTLGTGVGGGLILGGRLWAGSFGTSCEVGHIVIEPHGRPCKCGSSGCLETLASATAMTDMAKELINQGQECSYQGRLEDLTAAHLYTLAENGDQLARYVFDLAGSALGIALTNVFNLLGLQAAVIGGGAGAAFPFLKDKIREEISNGIFGVDASQFRLLPSILGDAAPLIGAPKLFLS